MLLRCLAVLIYLHLKVKHVILIQSAVLMGGIFFLLWVSLQEYLTVLLGGIHNHTFRFFSLGLVRYSKKESFNLPPGGHKPDPQCSGSKWGHGPGDLSSHYAEVP